MTDVGMGDLVAALAELVDDHGCTVAAASYQLADGALVTVSLDADGGLTIEREGAPSFTADYRRRRA